MVCGMPIKIAITYLKTIIAMLQYTILRYVQNRVRTQILYF